VTIKREELTTFFFQRVNAATCVKKFPQKTQIVFVLRTLSLWGDKPSEIGQTQKSEKKQKKKRKKAGKEEINADELSLSGLAAPHLPRGAFRGTRKFGKSSSRFFSKNLSRRALLKIPIESHVLREERPTETIYAVKI